MEGVTLFKLDEYREEVGRAPSPDRRAKPSSLAPLESLMADLPRSYSVHVYQNVSLQGLKFRPVPHVDSRGYLVANADHVVLLLSI